MRDSIIVILPMREKKVIKGKTCPTLAVSVRAETGTQGCGF